MSDHQDDLSKSPPNLSNFRGTSPPLSMSPDREVAALPFELFYQTPFGHKEECAVVITVVASNSTFVVNMPSVSAAEAQSKLKRCVESLAKKSNRKVRTSSKIYKDAVDRAKSPERAISPARPISPPRESGKSSRHKHAKSPERASTRKSPERSDARAINNHQMLDPDYDPGLICRTLEDQMARVKSLGSAAVVIPPNIDECFKFISRSFLQSPGLFVEPLSTKAFNALERYIRVLYRGQSIFSLESTTKLHYEEPNLVPHVILRYLRELPRSLLTVSDAVALSGSAATSHLVDLYVDTRKRSPEIRLFFEFLRLLWDVVRNRESNHVSSKQLANLLAPILFRSDRDGAPKLVDLKVGTEAMVFLLKNSKSAVSRCMVAELNTNATSFRSLTSHYPQLARLLLTADMALFRVLTDVMEPSLAGSLAPHVLRFLRKNSCPVVFLSRLVAKELSENSNPSTYFRSNNLATQLLSIYCKEEGHLFLQEALGPLLNQISKVDGSFEVKPSPNLSPAALAENQQRLYAYMTLVFNMVITALPELPTRFSTGMGQIAYQMVAGISGDSSFRHLILGSFLFLRFICPVLVSPEGFDLMDAGTIKPTVRNGLISISKVLQNMANRTKLKESHMTFLQPFIDDNMPVLASVFDQLSCYGETHPVTEALPALPYADFETCLAVHSYLAENLAEVDEQVREIGSAEAINAFKQVQMLLVEMPPPLAPLGSPELSSLSNLQSPFLLEKFASPSGLKSVVVPEHNLQSYWTASVDGELKRRFPAGVVQISKSAIADISVMSVDPSGHLWIQSPQALIVWSPSSESVVHQHPSSSPATQLLCDGEFIFALSGSDLLVFSHVNPAAAPVVLHLHSRNRTPSPSPESETLCSMALDHRRDLLWVAQAKSVHIVNAAEKTKRALIPITSPTFVVSFVLVVQDHVWIIDASGPVLLFDAITLQLVHHWTIEIPQTSTITAVLVFDNTIYYGLSDGRVLLLDPVMFLECQDLPHILSSPVTLIRDFWNPLLSQWEVVSFSENGSLAVWLPPSKRKADTPVVELPSLAPIKIEKPAAASSSSQSRASCSSAPIDAISRITIQYNVTDPRNPMSKITKSVVCTIDPQKPVDELISAFIYQLHHQGKKDFQEVMVVDSEGTELEGSDIIHSVWKKGELLFAELF